MRMPGAAKVRAPNFPTKDSNVVKCTDCAPKTVDNSVMKMRPPFADGTEKVTFTKSADRPNHTRVVLGMSTDFVGWTK
jgi:hypothetical protein